MGDGWRCSNPSPITHNTSLTTGSPLDRCTDHVAPLGPRAVVVADVRVAEQLVQHEPGVRGALADAAVDDDVLVWGDALGAVQLLELIRRLEGAVLGDRPRPGDALR